MPTIPRCVVRSEPASSRGNPLPGASSCHSKIQIETVAGPCIYIGVGLIMSILVGGTVLIALQGSAMLREPVEMRSVVVAARDIASRKPIEEGDVVVREVVADPTNEIGLHADRGRPGPGQRRARSPPVSWSPATCSPRPPPARRYCHPRGRGGVRPERPRAARRLGHRSRRSGSGRHAAPRANGSTWW